MFLSKVREVRVNKPDLCAEKKTVTLAIEHKERELTPKCLLALHLARKGFRVFIGSTEAIDVLATHLDPSIIFHKSTFNARSGFYRNMGHKFVFLDEEGGLTIQRSRVQSYCQERYGSLSMDLQDMVLVPGKTYYSILKDMHPGFEFRITGWPRIDLWRENYRGVYAQDAKKISDDYPDFFLFPTSFGSFAIDLYNQGSVEARASATADQERRADALGRYINFLKELSCLLDSQETIVLRPHHSESVVFWKKIFRGHKNIIVKRDGDISAWILSAKGLIQWGSTSAIQAAFQNKNNVQYQVTPIQGLTDTPSFELCENALNPAEALRLLRKNHRHEVTSNHAKASLKSDMHFSRDTLATTLVIEALKDLDTQKIDAPEIPTKSRTYLYLLYYGSRIKRALGLVGIHIGNKGQTIAEKIPGGIAKRELESIFKKISACENQDCNLALHQYSPNLVSIELEEART